MKFFAWYDNQSDPLGREYWEGAGWVEADSPEKAAKKAKQDGCLWTTVCVTANANMSYPDDKDILAKA